MSKITLGFGLKLRLVETAPRSAWDWNLRVVAGDILSELNELGFGTPSEIKFTRYLDIVAFSPEAEPVVPEELAELSELIRGSIDGDYESPEDAVAGVRPKDWKHAITVDRDAGHIKHDRALLLSSWADAEIRHHLISPDLEVA